MPSFHFYINSFFNFILIKTAIPTYQNPCSPSPCGPNSRCKESNGQPICSCENNFVGSPPNCRPECVMSSECSFDKACLNQKCSDPCANNICGQGATCRVMSHSPICSCPSPLIGDPFVRCYSAPRKIYLVFIISFKPNMFKIKSSTSATSL